MKFVVIALSLLALAGCAPEIRTVYMPVEPPKVPASLRRCAEAPDVPENEYSQRDVALFALDLADAYMDCRSKLGRVDALLKSYESENNTNPKSR